jgi:hypothetical protein
MSWAGLDDGDDLGEAGLQLRTIGGSKRIFVMSKRGDVPKRDHHGSSVIQLQ